MVAMLSRTSKICVLLSLKMPDYRHEVIDVDNLNLNNPHLFVYSGTPFGRYPMFHIR